MIEHAALKDGVSLGHTVKIGGEVEASVIEPYTNKQHHGFLGHSYLGSWINLGAGTCNSDLKNTYGKINIQYGEQKVATGMQFLGCIIGDYSKTAINTSIFTGKVIGVCSMMYGFVTSNVPSYVNYARLFGQTALLPADVMISTQQTNVRTSQSPTARVRQTIDSRHVRSERQPNANRPTKISLTDSERNMTNIRVGIVGATGYTALEVARLLLQHPHAEVVAATSRADAGTRLSEVHPSLAGRCEVQIELLDAESIAGKCDVVMCCLPHGASAETVRELVETRRSRDRFQCRLSAFQCRSVREMVWRRAPLARARRQDRLRHAGVLSPIRFAMLTSLPTPVVIRHRRSCRWHHWSKRA